MLWDLFVNGICRSSLLGYRLRVILLRLTGMKLDSNTAIHCNCTFNGNKLYLGEGSYINRNCTIDCAHGNIKIGNNVGVGFNCCLFTTNHDCKNPKKRTGAVWAEDVIIGDGCWIGGGTTICPGVEIEHGCVIAAGSVVVKNCKANSIYGGNPARFLKTLNEEWE